MTGPRRSLVSLYLLALLPVFACSAQVSGGGTGSGGSGSGAAGTSGQGDGGQTGGTTGTAGTGVAGTTGATGTAGTTGTTGVAGTTGTTGVAGTTGTTGVAGTTGGAGHAGTTGVAGTTGTTGVAGTTGTTGVAGTSGSGGAGGGPVDLTGRKALLLVDSPSSPSDGEVILEETLEERGMVVTIGASTGPASLATGMNVIVVSDSSGAGDFVPVFGTAAVPMIVFGNSAYQTLGWTASSSAKGTVDSTTSVTVVGGPPLASDLASGSSFTMILATQSTSLYWGTPGGKPIAIASIMGSATELIDFAYEMGTATATGTAPARRVGLGWKTNAIQNLTIDGFKLLSAALDWTAGSN